MTDKSLSDLIVDIEQELHQVSGPAVQVYSQDMLISRINNAFITFFDDPSVNWKRFTEYATYVLDGTTGKSTTDVSLTFREYDDIYRIYPSDSDRPLVKWNQNRNPGLIVGDYPRMVRPTSTAQKIFQVLPLTAAGSVTVVGKSRPTTWPFDDLADIVPFDYLAIVYYVAWQELSDDGTNPAATEDKLKLFQNRWKQLIARQGQEPVSYNGGSTQVPTQWRDSDA